MENDSVPISKTIAHQLESIILEGTLAPHEKIPSERQLADRLGVSRTMVREALRELQGRGMIETRHGQGSFVANMMPEVEDDSTLMHMFLSHSRTLYDLYDVREQLEGHAAYLAAKSGTDKDLYQITKAFNALENSNPLNNAELDHNFHLAIVEASHNAVLVHILSSLKKLILQTVHASVSNLSHRKKIRPQIDKHHRRIYQAIINRKPELAKKAATDHVRHVCENIRKIESHKRNVIRDVIKDENKN